MVNDTVAMGRGSSSSGQEDPRERPSDRDGRGGTTEDDLGDVDGVAVSSRRTGKSDGICSGCDPLSTSQKSMSFWKEWNKCGSREAERRTGVEDSEELLAAAHLIVLLLLLFVMDGRLSNMNYAHTMEGREWGRAESTL